MLGFSIYSFKRIRWVVICLLPLVLLPSCTSVSKNPVFKASFIDEKGNPYPFDVIISDGEWIQKFDGVTYIETEVPDTATYTLVYYLEGDAEASRWNFYFSPDEVKHFEFYALDIAQLQERIQPYISWQEKGANASLTWEWDSVKNILTWVTFGESNKWIGTRLMIDRFIQFPPNYVISSWDSENWCYRNTCKDGNTTHDGFVPAPADTTAVKFMQVNKNQGAIRTGYTIYNDAILTYPVNTMLHDLNGIQYYPRFIDPKYAIPANHYILQIQALHEEYVEFELPLNVKAGICIDLYNIYPPKISNIEPFMFYIAGEHFFANSLCSKLFHAQGDSITIQVGTNIAYQDWWGYFVLPDTLMVNKLVASSPTESFELKKSLDYIVNDIENYKLVMIRVDPKIEQLTISYR